MAEGSTGFSQFTLSSGHWVSKEDYAEYVEDEVNADGISGNPYRLQDRFDKTVAVISW